MAGIRRATRASSGMSRYGKGRYMQAGLIFAAAFVALGAKDILSQAGPVVRSAIRDRNGSITNTDSYKENSNWVGSKRSLEAPMGATGDLPLALNAARNRSSL